MILVFTILSEGIASNIEYLEMFEFHAFPLGKIGSDHFKSGDLIIANGKHIQFATKIKTSNTLQLIVEER